MASSHVLNGRGRFFLPGSDKLWQVARMNGAHRKRMQIYYGGSVQGVGFRYAVKKVASGYEVTGTVRNLTDGRVELIAEGTPEELESFRVGIRDAGLEHFIKTEEVSWTEAKNEVRGFEIAK